MVRAAIQRLGQHPELLERTDNLLWSINERLAGHPGLSLPQLGSGWLDDIMDDLEHSAHERAEAHQHNGY
jgi:hypothetical protein